MTDLYSPSKRSKIMSAIRSTGNRSTEVRAVLALRRHHVTGWRRHSKNVPGTPDFYFPRARLAVFVHGCFWHGCRRCNIGHVPKSRRDYWLPKIARNRARDERTRRALQRAGYRTMWVWEHDLRSDVWVARLRTRLSGPRQH
jgi:DNA mismatch endonuclease (patch repair protein)